MNKLIRVFIPVIIIFFLIIAFGPLYILYEGEQAVITQLGKIVRIETEAGLKAKWPIIESKTKYSKKILSWDGAPKELQTGENQFIWVDTTARWKISNPTKFYKTVKNMNQAYLKLDGVLDSAVRTVIAQNPLTEAVRNSDIIIDLQAKKKKDQLEVFASEELDEQGEKLSQMLESDAKFDTISKGRNALSRQMLANAANDTIDLGIELIDVVIRQIKYSEDMTQSVYDRMKKERNQIAQYYRSLGEGNREEWIGKMDNEKEVIISEAYAKSEEIKGNADALAAAIYNQSYGADPDFYEFWKAVESYKKTLPNMRKTLSTDMQYFNNFYQSEP